MLCSHPMTRIETYDGHVNFTSAYTGDAEACKEFAKKLKNQGNIKSVKIIPCGQCITCRLNRSREWANRIMLECKSYPENTNYFVTLTYDDEHVPINKTIDTNTGELITGLSLDKSHLQKFNHDLRKKWLNKYNHTGIRYYECGEYGEHTERPHYHLILMNLPHLDDLVYYKGTTLGDTLYTSETLSKLWKRGYVVVGKVTWDSASYVARYVMKKHFGKGADDYYKSKAKIPEFTTMSRRPGLGYNYYEENKNTIYDTDEIFVPRDGEVIKAKPGKYFDRKFEEDNPEKYKEVKRKREISNLRSTQFLQSKVGTIDNIQRQREIKERNITAKSRSLKRDL